MDSVSLRRLALSACCLIVLPLSAGAHDWHSWRGPEQTGVSREKDLPDRFSTDPKAKDNNLIWTAPYGGRASPIVMNGRVYLNNQVGEGVNEQERVMCFDAKNGKVLWEKHFNVFHTDIVSSRLGWTNMAGDPSTGNLYWHGTQGDFVCFDRDGKILWQRELTEQDGRISGYGGRITSPVVDGDLVIMGMLNSSWGDQGPNGNRYVAMNKHSGHVVWWSQVGGPPKDTYACTPIVAVINGQRLLISGGFAAVHAINVHDGKAVWSFPLSKGAVNASPVVAGTRVYVAHSNENIDSNTQGGVACLDAGEIKDGQPKLVWEREGIKVRYTSPLLHDGRLYVADDNARLHCLDAGTGESHWKFPFGRGAFCSPVWADGKIYVGDVNGTFQILEPGDKSCKRLYGHTFPPPAGGGNAEINGNPAVANGGIYFMTGEEFFCIGKTDHTAKADPIPPEPKEAPLGAPAAFRVYPADMTLRPGGTTTFTVHILDKLGREVGTEPAEGTWSLPAPPLPPKAKAQPPALKGAIVKVSAGKLTAGPNGKAVEMWKGTGGQLTVDAKVTAQQGPVMFTGKLGQAKARVRVVPLLPYAQNFDKLPDGVTPAAWVNAAGRVSVVPMGEGNKVLKRQNTNANPLFAEGNAYFGLPDMADYTIAADVMATKKGTDMSDGGVVASRYTLALVGNLQRLRLTSWEAIPRVDQAINFKFEPGVWYRMKLTTTARGDKVLARGKVWRRDDAEPAEWTVEFLDPTPNREGCPALYGKSHGIEEGSPGTELYYDNVSVTPNKKGAAAPAAERQNRQPSAQIDTQSLAPRTAVKRRSEQP